MNRVQMFFCAVLMFVLGNLGCAVQIDEQTGIDEIAFVQESLDSGDKMLPTLMPFYSEFDPLENPNGYDWCAQGAFKVVYKYQTGKYITLQQIERYLIARYGTNYSTCGVNKCSSDRQMLGIAVNDLGLRNSVIRPVSNVTEFFAKAKDGITYNYPPIVGSYVAPYAKWGHYWVVVGYRDTGNTNTGKLYLRNVAKAPVYGPPPQYDEVKTVAEFYHSYDTTHKRWYNVDGLLFIKP